MTDVARRRVERLRLAHQQRRLSLQPLTLWRQRQRAALSRKERVAQRRLQKLN